MERRNGAALCPRLIDYFLVVAGRQPQDIRHTVCSSPEILRRYPIRDHDDFLLPPDVSFFCQPEGCLNVTRQQMSHLVKNSSFVFCLTDKDTNKVRYGVTYSFYQLRSFDIPEDELQADETLLSTPKRHRHRRRYQLISLCILSHHPFFGTFRDMLMAIKHLIDRYEDKIQRLAHNHHLGRRSIWDFLISDSYNNSLAQVINQDIREIDTYILRLLSSPVPVPGKTRVEIIIGPPSFHCPIIFALPDRTRFSLVDFPIHLILEMFGADKCLLVLTAILLESKVLLQSRDYNALTMSILGLVSLLYPLEYMFPVIPLLPTCLRGAENLLLAPTPFLIGAPSTFLLHKKDFQLPDDIYVFNLDTGDVQLPTRLEKLPSLPEPEGSLLKTRFSQALASLSLANIPIEERRRSAPQIPCDPDSVDVAIRMAMVRFFVSENVLGNWSDHTRILRLYPRPVIGFQHNTFLKSRPTGCHFTAALVKTQAVECFCEWALAPDNDAWLRVLSGLNDTSAVGDKSRWYAQSLVPVSFSLLEQNGVLWKKLASLESPPPRASEFTDLHDDSLSGEESDTGSTISGVNITSIEDYVKELVEAVPEVKQPTPLTVNEDDVYAPPLELQLPDNVVSRANSSLADTTDSDGMSDAPSNCSSPLSSRKNSTGVGDSDPGGSESKTSLAERRGNHRLPGLNTEPRTSGSSDFEKTPKPGADFSPFPTAEPSEPIRTPPHANVQHHPQSSGIMLPFSPSSGSDSSDSAGIDLSTRDVIAAIQSDVVDIAATAKAKAKNATKHFSGLLDEVAAVAQHPPRSPSQNPVPSRHPTTPGPSRPPPPQRQPSTTTYASSPAPAKAPAQAIPHQTPPQQQQQPAHVQSLLAASEALRKHLPTPQQAKMITNKVLAGGTAMANSVKAASMQQNPGTPENANTRRSYKASADLAQRQQSLDAKSQLHSENQIFLSEIVQLSFEGQAVGWLKMNRLKKILEDETYRLFLLSKMNTQLSRKYRDEDAHVEDILLSRKQFKAFLAVLRAAIIGLETSYRNGASGGMASAFLLLEVAHTHYWQPEYGLKDPEAVSAHQQHLARSSGSPFGSREIASSSSTATPARDEPPNGFETRSVVVDGDQFENLTQIERKSGFSSPTDSSRRSSASSSSEPKAATVGPASGQILLKHALGKRQDSLDSNRSIVEPKTVLSLGNRFRGGKMIAVTRGVAPTREYLFQHVIGKDRSWLWDQMGFWEEAFIDGIAHERDLVGFDMNPQEMIHRYVGLADAEKKRLELDEDRLLAVMLFNAASYMLMVGCNRNEVRRKIRRLLGKSHLGLAASQSINHLLDGLNLLIGNDIDLKVPVSRLVRRYTFPVHLGTDNSGEMLFVEVCSDSIMLRSVSGQQRDRWWFDRLINMTYSPRTKVLCLWMKNAGDQVELSQFYTRKCRELYNRIKSSMEQTAVLNRLSRPGPNLYAEFPVTDLETDVKSVVQVTPDGICISEPSNSKFIDLCHVKRCYAQHGNVFVLELFDQDTGAIRQVKMQSDQADQICYNVLCVISMVASATSTASSQNDLDHVASSNERTRPAPPPILPAQSNPLAVNVKLDSLHGNNQRNNQKQG